MKTTTPLLHTPQRLANACVGSCRQMLRLVRRTKLSIFHEFGKRVDRHLLRLTLNEAEALAVQTQFPQLFFPTLALEKVEALRDWQMRQAAIRRPAPRELLVH